MGLLFNRELELPVKGTSERTTKREIVKKGETFTLFEDNKGTGCIFHWWLTTTINEVSGYEPSRDLQLKIYYDGEITPSVDISLADFYAILLGQTVTTTKIHNTALQVLPKNAFNCYFPMPFTSITFTMTNNSDADCCIWFMASWQRYNSSIDFTPLRFRVYHNSEFPAQPAGSYLMADITGSGFIAGMVLAIQKKDNSDAWFHNGGDLWLLDGESQARALRGIGGEDVFNMSFGIYDIQAEWMGCPYTKKTDADTIVGSGYEGIAYRIFGPDPVWFDTSAIIRFGTKANNYESLIYAYVCEKKIDNTEFNNVWELAGPFECLNWEDFNKVEWPQMDKKSWPAEYSPQFGQYLIPATHQNGQIAGSFKIPVYEKSEHGWIDFARNFRGRMKTNNGTQPENVSAYAYSRIYVHEKGKYRMVIGYDDWLKLWVNGKEVHIGRHDKGFEVDSIPVDLPQG